MYTKLVNGKIIQPGGIHAVSTNMDFPLNGQDSFAFANGFKNCDACGGNCVKSADGSYHNFLGLGNSYKKYDKQQRDQIYAELKAQFPDSTDCTVLDSSITQLQNVIDQYSQKMATNCDKGCKQVSSRHLDMATKRQTELKNLYTGASCDAQKQAASDTQFLDQTQQLLNGVAPTDIAATGNVLDSVKSGLGSLFGGSTDATTGATKPNYLLYAGIGVAAILGIVLIRKIF